MVHVSLHGLEKTGWEKTRLWKKMVFSFWSRVPCAQFFSAVESGEVLTVFLNYIAAHTLRVLMG